MTTTSDNAFGVYAAAGGTISSTAAMTVQTSGTGANSVQADVNGRGFDDSAPGHITLSNGGKVATTGPNAIGVYATGVGSTVAATGVAISTGATGSPGVQADAGGGVTLTGGSVATSAPARRGFTRSASSAAPAPPRRSARQASR